MRNLIRGAAWLGAAVAIVGGASVAIGQTRNEPAEPGSMAALTSEIRELRLAVQQLAQTQSQTQALGVYLSVQQSRVVQTASRLDSARHELEEATNRSSDLAARLADIEEQLPRMADAAERSAFQAAGRQLKLEQNRNSALERQARSRELELSQTLQAEESRWSDLISRLEALVAR